MVRIKRIYDEPSGDDGYRILVDRLWPRGISKHEAALDAWLKDVSPSPDLRVWFNHEAGKFDEFSLKYEHELAANPALEELENILAEHPAVTLLYAAKDPEINHAVVLKNFLESKRSR